MSVYIGVVLSRHVARGSWHVSIVSAHRVSSRVDICVLQHIRSGLSRVRLKTAHGGEQRSAKTFVCVLFLFLLCCASRSCVLGTCADLLSPPALLCHVAVCVWVSMFAIWILDFPLHFVYLFLALRESCFV